MKNSIAAVFSSMCGILIALNIYTIEVMMGDSRDKIWWLFILSVLICNIAAWIIIIKCNIKFDKHILSLKYAMSVIISVCLYVLFEFAYVPIASFFGLQYGPFYNYVFFLCEYIIVTIPIIILLKKLTRKLADTAALFLLHPIPHFCIFMLCFGETFSIAM